MMRAVFLFKKTQSKEGLSFKGLFRAFSSSDGKESSSSGSKDTEYTHFGYEEVKMNEKQSRVNSVFTSVASKYDVMNDLMSFGIHRCWKSTFVSRIGSLRPERIYGDDGKIAGYKPVQVLDVAGGTGDISFRIAEKLVSEDPKARDYLSITVSDINPEMLEEGKKRGEQLGYPEGFFNYQIVNAEQTEFPDESFDLYTISFGLRNVPDVPKALKEARRVLKKGGRFMCLEFSKVQNPLFREIYQAYSFGVLPVMGGIVANDSDSYKYLAESIDRFYSQEELQALMEEAGFKFCNYENLSDGIAAIHSGFKL